MAPANENEEVVEVDGNGNIHDSNGKLLSKPRKTILRDPEGEY